MGLSHSDSWTVYLPDQDCPKIEVQRELHLWCLLLLLLLLLLWGLLRLLLLR